MLQMPKGKIFFMMDINLLKPSHLIGLWLSASLSSLVRHCFWRRAIANVSGVSTAAAAQQCVTELLSPCAVLTERSLDSVWQTELKIKVWRKKKKKISRINKIKIQREAAPSVNCCQNIFSLCFLNFLYLQQNSGVIIFNCKLCLYALSC